MRTRNQLGRCRRLVAGIMLAAFSGTPLPALGADLLHPPWRGNAGTTYQSWSFSTDANPVSPELLANPYGQPVASIEVGYLGSGWIDQLEGLGTQTGYWDIGGEGGRIVIVMDPLPRPLAYQDIWVQATYFTDITQPPIVNVEGATRIAGQRLLVESLGGSGAWYLEQSLWRIDPPRRHGEPVVLTSEPMWGAIIDQIVVDTNSVQLPACHDPFADADGDGDVDQTDFAMMQSCLTGNSGDMPVSCDCFDRDHNGLGDGDVDAQDLAAFEACASAPGVAANPACDNAD
jgi:hypothetical protein